jgi:hypothetical protein
VGLRGRSRAEARVRSVALAEGSPDRVQGRSIVRLAPSISIIGSASTRGWRAADSIGAIDILGGPTRGEPEVHCAVVQLCCIDAGDRSTAA